MSEQLRIGQIQQLSLVRPDPARPMEGRRHREGTDTERAAALRVMPRSGTQRAKVLEALQSPGRLGMPYLPMGGLTDYELWQYAGVGARPHVPATRREELIAAGWPIVDSGERRPTDTGSPAIVWRLEE